MTSKKYNNPRGTNDILPEEISRWHNIESDAHTILKNYGYKEIRTPYFEETALFARSLGTTSDVVQKQMLNLAGAAAAKMATGLGAGDSTESAEARDGLSLRPEGTASIVRSYIQNSFAHKEGLSKFYYIGPMFRGERPQKGRLRQFHQIGVEAIGPESFSPYLDAEVIALSVRLLNAFGLSGYKLKINSLGTKDDKNNLSVILRDRLCNDLSKLCQDCQDRFERNVFRILDCKNESCKKVVSQLSLGEDHLSPESRAYFSKVKEALTLLNIPFEVESLLVRGLDYYTHTVFEISHAGLGSQDAVGAGGRYNGLVQELGGDPKGEIGAIGFALGIERILLVQPDDQKKQASGLDAFIVTLDSEGKDDAYKAAFKLLNQLRSNGIAAEMNYNRASMKSQMRLADKLQSRRVIIIGEDELKNNYITLKNMQAGTQEKVDSNEVINLLKK